MCGIVCTLNSYNTGRPGEVECPGWGAHKERGCRLAPRMGFERVIDCSTATPSLRSWSRHFSDGSSSQPTNHSFLRAGSALFKRPHHASTAAPVSRISRGSSSSGITACWMNWRTLGSQTVVAWQLQAKAGSTWNQTSGEDQKSFWASLRSADGSVPERCWAVGGSGHDFEEDLWREMRSSICHFQVRHCIDGTADQCAEWHGFVDVFVVVAGVRSYAEKVAGALHIRAGAGRGLSRSVKSIGGCICGRGSSAAMSIVFKTERS